MIRVKAFNEYNLEEDINMFLENNLDIRVLDIKISDNRALLIYEISPSQILNG